MSIAKSSMRKVYWQDVRKRVAEKNAELAAIIDEISPGKTHPLYHVTYPFGAEVLKDGVLFIPNKDGDLVPLTDPQISKEIQKDLGYNLNSNPMCFILKNSAELFIKINDALVTLFGLIEEGRFFGLSRVLSSKKSEHPVFTWNMTAGARSLFLLPKIAEKGRHNRLSKAFDLNIDPPKSHLDQWHIFRDLAQHPNFGQEWNLEILYFSKTWIDSLDDSAWQKFKLYLFGIGWDNSEYMRSRFMWDAMISIFHNNRNISPDPYIADTAKNLLFLGSGWIPGFSVATNDIAGPIKRLQKLYLEEYKLTDYAPVMMRPDSFDLTKGQPIYYSLAYPMAAKLMPRFKTEVNKLSDIYNIRGLLMKYLSDIRSTNLNLMETAMHELPVQVEYEFFHANPEGHTGILATGEIPKGDSYFAKIPLGAKREFPVNSSFLNGCVRVRPRP